LNVHRELLCQYCLYLTQWHVTDMSVTQAAWRSVRRVVNWKGCGRKRSYRSWGCISRDFSEGIEENNSSLITDFQKHWNWGTDFHIRYFTVQSVIVLLMFWAPNAVSTYVRLSIVTSLLSFQCTYMPGTENITERMACRVVQMRNEFNSSDYTTKKGIHSAMTYPTTCDR